MKKHFKTLALAAVCLSLVPAYAQFGGPPGGPGGPGQAPQFSGAMAKVLGDISAFSAVMEMQMQAREQTVTMPGKFAFDQGKSRFEMNLGEAKGMQMPPEAAEHMKSMGMDKMVMIALPEKKVACLIYPGLQAYVETPLTETDATKAAADYKVETSELGKETVDGHPCVKSKMVVTDDKGKKHEWLVWNATDLKKFPVKVESTTRGETMTIFFKDVKLSKPDAGQFAIPSDYKKYDSMMALMQQEMMKRMGGGMGTPPGQ